MKTKISRLMILLMITVVLVLPATFAATLNTHIDSISPITCKQGDTVTATAQLWTENYVDGLWDNPMGNQELNFSIYSDALEDQTQIILNKTEETKLNGKATANFDTKNIDPGEYILIVEFKGNSGLIADFKPCSTKTNFTVNS
jgi:hypothetical protein